METVRCDVANAGGAGQEVLVHLGRREARADGASGVGLARTVRLTPYGAKRLQELLAALVRDHDQRRGDPG